MNQPDADSLDLLAGEYVLGTLRGDARRRFAERLARDPALARLVAAWERRLAPLAESVPPAPPPAGARAAIERRLEAEFSAEGSRTIRADSGDWTEIAPGVTMKRLYREPGDARESVLLRLLPGATLPAHEHPQSEECLVLEGAIDIGELHLAAGDFHVALPGAPHDRIHSRRGALLFIRGTLAA
jgi:quercetin dioxygenase-like cupin family protein